MYESPFLVRKTEKQNDIICGSKRQRSEGSLFLCVKIERESEREKNADEKKGKHIEPAPQALSVIVTSITCASPRHIASLWP